MEKIITPMEDDNTVEVTTPTVEKANQFIDKMEEHIVQRGDFNTDNMENMVMEYMSGVTGLSELIPNKTSPEIAQMYNDIYASPKASVEEGETISIEQADAINARERKKEKDKEILREQLQFNKDTKFISRFDNLEKLRQAIINKDVSPNNKAVQAKMKEFSIKDTKSFGVLQSDQSNESVSVVQSDQNVISINTTPTPTTRIFASGKYQTIPTTLQGAVDAGAVDPNKPYDKEQQEKAGKYLLFNKRKKLRNYLTKGEGTEEEALLELSKEWASLPNPKTGKSYHGGANKSSHSIEEVRKALRKAKQGDASPLLLLISKGESGPEGYKAFNRGVKGGEILKGDNSQDITKIKVSDLILLGRKIT